MPVNTLLQLRRGTAQQWVDANQVAGQGILYNGEIGYETDTGRFKIGDGFTAWSGINYASVLPEDFSGISGIAVEVIGTGAYLQIALTGIETTQVNNLSGYIENVIINSEKAVNLESVQDIIGLSGVRGGFGVDKSYDDNTGHTTLSATGMALRVDAGEGIQVTATTENNNNVYTVAVTGIGSNLVNDFTEAAQDAIALNAGDGGFLVNGTGLQWQYNDASNNLEVGVTGIDHTLITDWDAALSGNIDTQLIAGNNIDFTYDGVNNTLTISTTSLDDTHTHVWDNITDAKTKATLTELGYLSGVVPGTVSASRALVVDANKDLNGINELTTTGDVTIGGDLVVAGTATTVNSTVVEIGDNIIKINTSGLPTGGLEVRDSGTTNYKQFIWSKPDTRWEFTEGADVYTSGNITADTLTSEVSYPTAPLTVSSSGLVSNLNADLLDGQHGSYYRSWNNITDKPDPEIEIILSGDVEGTGTYTWTDLGGDPSITINTSVYGGSIELGEETVGDYVESISVSGTGLSIDETSGEGSTPVITSNATPASGLGTLVARDTDTGGFSAGDVSVTKLVVDDTLTIDSNTIVAAANTDIKILTSGNANLFFGQESRADITGSSDDNFIYSRDYTGNTEVSGLYNIVMGNGNAAMSSLSILIGSLNENYDTGNILINNGVFSTDLNTIANGSEFSTIFSSRDSIVSGVSEANGIYSSKSSLIDDSQYSVVIGSLDSDIQSSLYSSIIGGNSSSINGYNATHILGSGITASQGHTTFVENLISVGDVISSGNISGDGSLITNINADNISTGTVDELRLPLASTTATGIAVFSNSSFSVNVNGLVTIKNEGISNDQLLNDNIIFGSETVYLGDTVTGFAGLTYISGTNMSTSPTRLYNVIIDGGTP